MNDTMSSLRLLAGHLRAGLRASFLVAFLVMITVFVVAVVPRAFAAVATAELGFELSEQNPVRLDLTGEGRFTLPSGGSTAETMLAATGDAITNFPSTLPSPLADGADTAIWLVKSASGASSTPGENSTALALRLAVDLTYDERLRYISGAAPRPWTLDQDASGQDAAGQPTPIEIAISQKSATEMKLDVGDTLEYSPAPLLIAGIYEPVDADDTYWSHAYDLERPAIISETGQPLRIQATVYVAPDSIVALRDQFAAGVLSAWIPVDPHAYSFADRQLLTTQVRNVTATPVTLPDHGELGLRSSFADVIESTEASVAATFALIALAASGPLGVLVATYALSIQTLVRRRRFSLSLASARGASNGQLRWVMVIEAALIALPGAAVAIAAAAILVPERVGIDGWLAPVVLALTPIVLAAVLVSPGSLREARRDISVRSTSRLRWIAEAAVIGAAVVALVLLQQRGLVASGGSVGIDPLLAATPLLLAASVGLLTLRVFPIPLRGLRALVRGRVAPVAEVGSARAIREPAIGAVATLTLIVGVAIVVFSTIMVSTVEIGMQRGAAEFVGADARVDAHDLPESLVDEVRSLPDVVAAAPLTIQENLVLTDEAGTIRVRVALVDAAALAAVRPDLLALGPSTEGSRPMLVSQSVGDLLQGTTIRLGDTAVQPVGVVADSAIPGMFEKWVIVDASAADELGLSELVPSRLLIDLADDFDDTSVEAIRTAVLAVQPYQFVASARFYDVHSELAQRRAAPVTSGLESALVLIAGATLILTMLVVALAAAASAASRNRVVGVLRIIGMTPRQVRALIAWEFGPVAIAALLVGTALGIGLPYLVTAVIDLRGFLGGTTLPSPALDPLWILGAVGIYAVTILATVLVAAALGRRLAPASTLKMGEQ